MKKLMLLAGLLLGCLFMSQAQTIKVGPPAGPKFTFRGGVSNLATMQGTDMIPNATSVFNYANGYLAASPILISSIADGQVLKWSTANTRWENGTVSGGGGTPGGSNSQIQYNNSGSFAGSVGNTWDNTSRFQTITAGLASTNTVTDRLVLSTNTTGTPAIGLGSSLAFQVESSTVEDTDAGRIGVKWNTVTHATRTSTMDFSVYNSGSIGNVLSLGLGVATVTGNVSMTGKAIVSTLGTLPSTLVGRNASQEIASVTMGTGLTLSAGTLTATGPVEYQAGQGTATNATWEMRVWATGTGITATRVSSTDYQISIPSGVQIQKYSLYIESASGPGATDMVLTFDYASNPTLNQNLKTTVAPWLYAVRANGALIGISTSTAAAAHAMRCDVTLPTVANGDLKVTYKSYNTTFSTDAVLYGIFF